MRKKQHNQMPLMITSIDHSRAKELKRISEILDRYPIISKMVWQDLIRDVHNEMASPFCTAYPTAGTLNT